MSSLPAGWTQPLPLSAARTQPLQWSAVRRQSSSLRRRARPPSLPAARRQPPSLVGRNWQPPPPLLTRQVQPPLPPTARTAPLPPPPLLARARCRSSSSSRRWPRSHRPPRPCTRKPCAGTRQVRTGPHPSLRHAHVAHPAPKPNGSLAHTPGHPTLTAPLSLALARTRRPARGGQLRLHADGAARGGRAARVPAPGGRGSDPGGPAPPGAGREHRGGNGRQRQVSGGAARPRAPRLAPVDATRGLSPTGGQARPVQRGVWRRAWRVPAAQVLFRLWRAAELQPRAGVCPAGGRAAHGRGGEGERAPPSGPAPPPARFGKPTPGLSVLRCGATVCRPIRVCAQEARFSPVLAPADLRERHVNAQYRSAEDLEDAAHVVQMEEDMALRCGGLGGGGVEHCQAGNSGGGGGGKGAGWRRAWRSGGDAFAAEGEARGQRAQAPVTGARVTVACVRACVRACVHARCAQGQHGRAAPHGLPPADGARHRGGPRRRLPRLCGRRRAGPLPSSPHARRVHGSPPACSPRPHIEPRPG